MKTEQTRENSAQVQILVWVLQTTAGKGLKKDGNYSEVFHTTQNKYYHASEP